MPDGVCSGFDHHGTNLGEHNIWDVYHEMRLKCPVAHSDRYDGFWVLTRYDDVLAAIRNHETFSSAQGVRIPEGGRALPIDFDPPEHSAYRELFTAAFAPQQIKALLPFVRELVKELVGDLARDGGGDFVTAVAEPLPLRILTPLVGFSDETVSQLRRLTQVAMSADADTPLNDARRDIRELMAREIEEHRARPRPDHITTLLDSEVLGRPVTDDELVAALTSFAIAGHESTVSALASTAYILSSQPDVQDQVRQDPTCIPRFVEEVLRVRTPFHFFARTTTRLAQVGDVEIPAGERVLLSYAAANRDDDKFPGADEVDISRGARGHLAFGYGLHHCVGAPVARTELRVVVEELCALPPLRLDGEPEFTGIQRGSSLGYRRLPVRFAR